MAAKSVLSNQLIKNVPITMPSSKAVVSPSAYKKFNLTRGTVVPLTES